MTARLIFRRVAHRTYSVQIREGVTAVARWSELHRGWLGRLTDGRGETIRHTGPRSTLRDAKAALKAVAIAEFLPGEAP